MAVANLKHNRVNIRKTHPGLYHQLMTVAVGQVGLSFSFWLSDPTFNPYDIHKNIVGIIFCILGVSQIFFLNLIHRLPWVRTTTAVSIGITFAWGASNSQQSFNGNASFQLPIIYMILCAMQLWIAFEAPVNLTTKKKSK